MFFVLFFFFPPLVCAFVSYLHWGVEWREENLHEAECVRLHEVALWFRISKSYILPSPCLPIYFVQSCVFYCRLELYFMFLLLRQMLPWNRSYRTQMMGCGHSKFACLCWIRVIVCYTSVILSVIWKVCTVVD